MISTVGNTIVLVSLLTSVCIGHGQDESNALGAKFIKEVDESFKTVETKITVLSAQVSSLAQDMKVVERAGLVSEMHVTQMHEVILKGEENTESLKAITTEVTESVKQLKNSSDALVTELNNRLLDMEKKQEEAVVSMSSAVANAVKQLKDETGHAKGWFELPDTADNTQNDENKTHSENFNTDDFSSWAQFTKTLVRGEAHQILLFGILAVILSQIILQIHPTLGLREESDNHQSMKEIAKSTVENQEKTNELSGHVKKINCIAEKLENDGKELKEKLETLENNIITENERIETLSDTLDTHMSSTNSLSETVVTHREDFSFLKEDVCAQNKSFEEKLQETITRQQQAKQEHKQTTAMHKKKLDESSSDITELKRIVENIEATQKTYVAEEAFKKTERNLNKLISTQATATRKKMGEDSDKIIQLLTDVVIKRTNSLAQHHGNTVGSMPVLLSKVTAALARYTTSSSDSEDTKKNKVLLSEAAAALDRYTLSSSSDAEMSDLGGYPIVRQPFPDHAFNVGHSSGHVGRDPSLDSGFKAMPDDEDEDGPVTCEEDLA